MAVEYICKICRGHLNVKTSIVLAASKLHSSQRGLVFLNPEIGNYTTTTHPSFSIKEGEESPKQHYRISLARVHKKPDSYVLIKSEKL